MPVSGQSLCLIDGSGYIFRAFYALPPMHRPDGTPTNAVYGFTSMMINLLQENACNQVLVVFDAKRKNFRNDIYPEYKANRLETPPELIPQFPLIRQACDALNIDRIEMEGYEADDLIATYARIATAQGKKVRIISADKDLMQLMQKDVVLHDPMKKKDLTTQDVIHKFGVSPNKVVEVQSLMGDSTDNIPGASGIGPKTAASLIQQFGTIENLYKHLEQIKSEKQREKLKQDKEKVFISKQLVSLDAYAPVDADLSKFTQKTLDCEKALKFLKENNFPSLIKKLNIDSFDIEKKQQMPDVANILVKELKEQIDFETLITKAKKEKKLAFNIKTDDNESFITDIFFAPDINEIFHLNLKKQESLDLFSFAPSCVDAKTIQNLNDLFDLDITFLGYDIKKSMHLLNKTGVHFGQNFQDILLMQYDCSGTKFNKITDMIKHHLNLTDIDENHFAVLFHPLFEIIKEKLENQNLWGIYRDVDLPLIPWLFQMEKAGILTDEKQLQILNQSFTEKLNDLSKQIHAITGEDFNINSPAQLGVILFEQRGLAGGKKGPSGHWITDVKVLETLLEETDDELIRLILEYRSLNKLKSTYIDDLIERNKKDKRIHTSYSLTSTNTGRLSSSNPNLQNIPVRTQEGKNIRQVFVSKPGYSLISADYSQIELRLMADFANVQKLKDAFIKGDDIHAQTASQILSIPLNQVTPDQRRQAKAVNFGIIYGISSFGLARNLGISRSQAKQYIDAYFTQYPEIKTYMDKTIQFAQKNGFVKTPIGRRIYIDGFNIPAMRQFANRSAINAPIQGGAADIIKMAMIRVFKVLKESKLDITPLLQVHDELIFEVAEKDIESAKQIIKENMEKVIKLSIPLVAEIGVADNWLDAH